MQSSLALFGLFVAFGSLVSAQSKTKIDFERDIAPILERSCIQCHHAGTSSSNLQLISRDEIVKSNSVVPGKPDESPLYTTMASGWMPPGKKASDGELALIRTWIKEGAPWPSGVALHKGGQSSVPPDAEIENVRRIRERIAANSEHSSSKSYRVTIPNTTISYEMASIPAGQFEMGSAAAPDEQPQHRVTLDAFWMQTREVTWDEYRLFMFAAQAGEVAHKDGLVDAVTRPTRPYVEMSFGMGIEGYPAISMTQHAANKYAEWLSAKTGEFYRLPTEAEWEYACRAPTTMPSSQLGNYGWFSANSDGKYQKVGTKKPNAWGLYDMLGNVMEWTLDQYAPYQGEAQTNPWFKPTKPYPIVVRGGSWNDPASSVTCEARVASDPSWKQQDPQLPKSIWYETDAQWLGFRLVRPAKLPAAEEMYRYWNNGVEHDEQ